ncbi:PEGA domain-containing protein [Leptothrix cholodnii]|nr:PEGA domain-containing protein [Leptothrix cholodnii]
MKLKFLALACVVALGGCSSIIKGTSETISVNSIEKGTTIYVDGAARGLDSASVSVKKGKPHSIRAEKDGCQAVTADTTETFDPTSLLGILLDFGIFSIPIDLMSGAAWKVEPTTYTVTPICQKQ